MSKLTLVRVFELIDEATKIIESLDPGSNIRELIPQKRNVIEAQRFLNNIAYSDFIEKTGWFFKKKLEENENTRKIKETARKLADDLDEIIRYYKNAIKGGGFHTLTITDIRIKTIKDKLLSLRDFVEKMVSSN